MLTLDWNILFTLINLVIFYLLMKRFLFKPILKVMNQRKEMINKQFEDADNAKSEAEALKKQYEEKLQGADDESERILSDARESANNEYSRIIDRAEEDAAKMKAEAQKRIEAENEKAVLSAREDIASLAIKTAEKLVGANISKEQNSAIFDEFLKESSEDS